MRLPFSPNRPGPSPPLETGRAEPSSRADVRNIQQRLAKALNRSEASAQQRDVDATEPAANLPQPLTPLLAASIQSLGRP